MKKTALQEPYQTDDIEERNMTVMLRDLFAEVRKCGATEDPLSVIGKCAVRCLDDVQFAYYCYEDEEVGHVAAVREGIGFFMPSPAVERKIVALLWKQAKADAVSVMESKVTRPLLAPADRKHWQDFSGFILRIPNEPGEPDAILALYMTAGYPYTARQRVWMEVVASMASASLTRYGDYMRLKSALDNPAFVHQVIAKRALRDPELAAWVRKGMDDPRVKMLVGVRGSNKLNILKAVRKLLLDGGVSEDHVVFIDCEDANFRRFKTADDVIAYLGNFPKSNRPYHLFVDGLGMIRWHFELLSRLQTLKGWDVWLASSSSHVLPEGKHALDSVMVRRVWTDAGIPRSHAELSRTWAQIFMRDIVGEINSPDIRAMELLAEFYSDHIGEVVSLRDVSRNLSEKGRSLSTVSIRTYRAALVDANLIEFAMVYDVFGREVIKTLSGHVFYTDLELRKWRFGAAPEDDATRLALNRLYLELRRTHENVYTPRDCEADFVTVDKKGNPKFWNLPADPLLSPEKFRGGGGIICDFEDSSLFLCK